MELTRALPKMTEMNMTDKAPVFLTVAKEEKLHEPVVGDGCFPVDMSGKQVFIDEYPSPERKLDGG